jgi:cytoskeletal protein CcmA (bactofilin family)
MSKKSEYSDIKESERVDTVFSETTAFNGALMYETSLKIDGYFKGKISSKGHLIIGEKAKVYANVQANTIVIAGEVKGDVEALERLEMLPTAKLYGNIRTKKLKMADGVVFEGRCEMLGPTGRSGPVQEPQESRGQGADAEGSQGRGVAGQGAGKSDAAGNRTLDPIIEEENEEVVKTN